MTNRSARPLAFALLLQGLAAQSDPVLPEPPGLQAIQAQDMMTWAAYLASDQLGGRLTGSKGQQLAARYIADHFKALGLEPLGDEVEGKPRSFFQTYPLTRTRVDAEASRIELAGGGAAGEQAEVFRKGFAVIPAQGEDAGVDREVEFVYGGLLRNTRFTPGTELEDWTGKVPVLVIRRERTEGAVPIERQMMTGTMLLAGLKRRVERFGTSGAPAVAVCVLDDASAAANMLTYMSIAPGQDMMNKEGAFGMGMMMQGLRGKVPAVFLASAPAKAVLTRLGLSLAAADDPVGAEDLPKLRQARGRVVMKIEADAAATATNVVAVLRGSDPTVRSEAVVYSAHMDHVGRRMDGDAYNGADDNASGSAGLMAIAKAYATSAEKPRRSIVFLSVSGEELGLWGSAYFASHPTWPAESIVANVNTDMIGRSGPESGPKQVTVTPSYRHPKFSTIVGDAARIGGQMGLEFEIGDKYYQRSDHYNFARIGIPVVFFCNGEHEDYHQVSDHADKLDGDKMQSIARLAYWTGYRVAIADERPQTLGRTQGWTRRD